MATYPTSTFKYTSHCRLGGHQIGPKVGDMPELLTMGAVFQRDDLRPRLHTEPKGVGFSGAEHKVEVVILNEPHKDQSVSVIGSEISGPSTILSFIECTKVGAEQSINDTFKKSFPKHGNRSFEIPFGSNLEVKFASRGVINGSL